MQINSMMNDVNPLFFKKRIWNMSEYLLMREYQMILQMLFWSVLIKTGGLGGEAPNKLLKGPSGKAGGPFDVACQNFTFFGMS